MFDKLIIIKLIIIIILKIKFINFIIFINLFISIISKMIEEQVVVVLRRNSVQVRLKKLHLCET